MNGQRSWTEGGALSSPCVLLPQGGGLKAAVPGLLRVLNILNRAGVWYMELASALQKLAFDTRELAFGTSPSPFRAPFPPDPALLDQDPQTAKSLGVFSQFTPPVAELACFAGPDRIDQGVKVPPARRYRLVRRDVARNGLRNAVLQGGDGFGVVVQVEITPD